MTIAFVTRLYVVAATDTGIERLIRAESKAKAVALASAARIATQSDLERLFSLGVIAEVSDAELRPPPPPPEPPAPESLAALVARRGRPKGSRNKPTNGKPTRSKRTSATNRSTLHV
jgi:hypothetical protein